MTGRDPQAAPPPVPRRVVVCLGVSQFICWGISYYLMGAIGEAMAQDLGWERTVLHGGFALALLVMGTVSGAAGRLVDRQGGRRAMVMGSVLQVAGCLGLAAAPNGLAYYAAWVVLGVAMRLTLYDAAFAALAHLAGSAARQPMAQITLLGGLASTAFWPLGHVLSAALGWRGTLLVYAALALLTVPLHLAIPRRGAGSLGRVGPSRPERDAPAAPLAAAGRARLWGAALFAAMTTLANFLNAGMSAHMVGMLSGLGLALPLAVGVAALRGLGQSAARLAEVLFGARLHPLGLGSLAALLMPLGCLAGLVAGGRVEAAVAFALLYGAGNGLLTITRGTLPLVLFDHRTYGGFVGRLVAPGFVVSACAPVAYAALIERAGAGAAMALSLGVAALVLLASLALQWRFAPRRC